MMDVVHRQFNNLKAKFISFREKDPSSMNVRILPGVAIARLVLHHGVSRRRVQRYIPIGGGQCQPSGYDSIADAQ
jgi:hypothetical protein